LSRRLLMLLMLKVTIFRVQASIHSLLWSEQV
jgi:hypothetical protein